MSNQVFNGISCSGIMGNIDNYKKWIVYVWYIEPETKVPMKHYLVKDLNELDKAIKDLKSEFGNNAEYIVVLEDEQYNYIPISFSSDSLKLAIETDEEYWDRVADEYLEEVYAKEELQCVNMW